MQARIKNTAIPRAGYEYQDLVGIEVLIGLYRDPNLYSWVKIETDDSVNRALDDVVAERRDGTLDLIQVKFTVDSNRYELNWEWLLQASEGATSLIAKWAKSFARVSALGPIHSARLYTNRVATNEFKKCLKSSRVQMALLTDEVRASVVSDCGGATEAEKFFDAFDFLGGQPNLDEYERSLRELLVPADTDSSGWLALREAVRDWAMFKHRPSQDGRIERKDVLEILSTRRPRPIRQDFSIPEDYSPPSKAFDRSLRRRINESACPITVLWGTPGRGKSTYLSYLTRAIRERGGTVARHHYFLSSEDPGSHRTSFVDVAMSMLDQLLERNGASHESPNNIRAAIETAAADLARRGSRLFLIVDGLDHVWRSTQHVDQLDHLFNELLPLPLNVYLIVGTQRVPIEQLPRQLVVQAKSDDWIEIPAMDEVAVSSWVMRQDEVRPIPLRFDSSPEHRANSLAEVARAFYDVSRGHPLHLIYAFEECRRSVVPLVADDVRNLPRCPGGDIREYYAGLWIRIDPIAKRILHVLAGSEFFWPSLGIRKVFGDFSHISHLVEKRDIGMVPFHASIFSWVSELPEHDETYRALLPEVIDWLANDAPDYWRWGWLWLVQAQTGSYEQLLVGTSRQWVASSLAMGWSAEHIEQILATAAKRSFDIGDLPRAISLRILLTRVGNVQNYQSREFGEYLATAVAVSGNQQQVLNLLDSIQQLSDKMIEDLSHLSGRHINSELLTACYNELMRRINIWIQLRHRSNRDFGDLVQSMFVVSGHLGTVELARALKVALGFREPEFQVSALIQQVGRTQNTDGLKFLRGRLRGERWTEQRRLILDSLVRCSNGSSDSIRVRGYHDEPVSAFSACWFAWRHRRTKLKMGLSPVPANITSRYYPIGAVAELTTFFYEAFWSALNAALKASQRSYSFFYPGLPGIESLGWLPRGLGVLEDLAREIAHGQSMPTFSAVYVACAGMPLVQFEPDRVAYSQYCSFSAALVDIAVDLHRLGISSVAESKIPASEFEIARGSIHWSNEVWVNRNVRDRNQLLEPNGAAELISEESAYLESTVVEFSERCERWTRLASLAVLYSDDRQSNLLARATACLIGYGWRKDLSALDLLDSVQVVGTIDSAVSKEWLDTLVPLIDKIEDFTDGDETNYVRSKLIEVVASVAPACLPSLYDHHLSADEYSYADECLVELLKIMNLDATESRALVSTLIDDRTLGVLESRASNEPIAAELLELQFNFLGRIRTLNSVRSISPLEPLRTQEIDGAVNPISFGPRDLGSVVEAAKSIDYTKQRDFLTSWLWHWERKKKASQMLAAADVFYNETESSYAARDILDDIFVISEKHQGKDTAYRWLVRAHIEMHGWGRYESEDKALLRLQLASTHYSDRWMQYIRDTSVGTSRFPRRPSDFVIGSNYLVRFLLLVGQDELAKSFTRALVNAFVEEVREQPIPEALWFR